MTYCTDSCGTLAERKNSSMDPSNDVLHWQLWNTGWKKKLLNGSIKCPIALTVVEHWLKEKIAQWVHQMTYCTDSCGTLDWKKKLLNGSFKWPIALTVVEHWLKGKIAQFIHQMTYCTDSCGTLGWKKKIAQWIHQMTYCTDSCGTLVERKNSSMGPSNDLLH